MQTKLRNFIFQELVYVSNPDAFDADGDLLEAGLDSMGIMRLIIFIEEEFGVTLPDNEIDPDNLRTLNALKNWILRHRSE